MKNKEYFYCKKNNITHIVCKRYSLSKFDYQNNTELIENFFEYSLCKCKKGYYCIYNSGFYNDDSFIYFSRNKKLIYDLFYLRLLNRSWFKNSVKYYINRYKENNND